MPIARTLKVGDRIEVNIAPTNDVNDPRKYAINEVFDHEGYAINRLTGARISATAVLALAGLGVEPQGAGAPPVFPQAEFNRLVGTDYAAAKGLQAKYEMDMKAWRDGGTFGAPRRALADQIGDAVLGYLGTAHGFEIVGRNGVTRGNATRVRAQIDPAHLTVVAPNRAHEDAPVLWTLQLAPVWGN